MKKIEKIFIILASIMMIPILGLCGLILYGAVTGTQMETPEFLILLKERFAVSENIIENATAVEGEMVSADEVSQNMSDQSVSSQSVSAPDTKQILLIYDNHAATSVEKEVDTVSQGSVVTDTVSGTN